jgi:hypothetical protein
MLSACRCVLPLLLFGACAQAGQLVLSSGTQQRLLMELYTSEGCSSCPPMEDYLNSFKTSDGLWETYVPAAFHVDYWDFLGWKDRFASPAFAERHRRHDAEGHVSTVYTPALIVNGQAWRPGLAGGLPDVEKQAAGRFEVRVDDSRLTADYRPLEDQAGPFELHVALLGMGLESNVTEGENEGDTLVHEFVVIGFKTVPAKSGHWQTGLPAVLDSEGQPRALAVWVTPAGSLKPLQAAGGYLASSD